MKRHKNTGTVNNYKQKQGHLLQEKENSISVQPKSHCFCTTFTVPCIHHGGQFASNQSLEHPVVFPSYR